MSNIVLRTSADLATNVPEAPVIFNRTVGDGLTQLFGVVLAPSAKPNALLAALDSLVL